MTFLALMLLFAAAIMSDRNAAKNTGHLQVSSIYKQEAEKHVSSIKNKLDKDFNSNHSEVTIIEGTGTEADGTKIVTNSVPISIDDSDIVSQRDDVRISYKPVKVMMKEIQEVEDEHGVKSTEEVEIEVNTHGIDSIVANYVILEPDQYNSAVMVFEKDGDTRILQDYAYFTKPTSKSGNDAFIASYSTGYGSTKPSNEEEYFEYTISSTGSTYSIDFTANKLNVDKIGTPKYYVRMSDKEMTYDDLKLYTESDVYDMTASTPQEIMNPNKVNTVGIALIDDSKANGEILKYTIFSVLPKKNPNPTIITRKQKGTMEIGLNNVNTKTSEVYIISSPNIISYTGDHHLDYDIKETYPKVTKILRKQTREKWALDTDVRFNYTIESKINYNLTNVKTDTYSSGYLADYVKSEVIETTAVSKNRKVINKLNTHNENMNYVDNKQLDIHPIDFPKYLSETDEYRNSIINNDSRQSTSMWVTFYNDSSLIGNATVIYPVYSRRVYRLESRILTAGGASLETPLINIIELKNTLVK